MQIFDEQIFSNSQVEQLSNDKTAQLNYVKSVQNGVVDFNYFLLKNS